MPGTRSILVVCMLLTLAVLLVSCSSPQESAVAPTFERMEIYRYAVDTTATRIEKGALTQSIVEEYNEEGESAQSVYRDAGGNVQMQFFNTFENGKKTRIDWRSEDSTLVKYVLNSYSEDGRLFQSRHFTSADSFDYGFQNVWEDEGLLNRVGPMPEEGEAFEPVAVYRLDDRGDSLELTEYEEGDSLYAYVTWDYLERDAYGNWTLRHYRIDGEVDRIEERTITYR